LQRRGGFHFFGNGGHWIGVQNIALLQRRGGFHFFGNSDATRNVTGPSRPDSWSGD
jgi:hypothetical protein